jgi:hypothetical protein
MITVSSRCNACKQTYVWKRQPYLLGLFAAGNLLLSFAILTAGGSVTKVLNIFKNMGILAYRKGTFYNHQRYLLIPQLLDSGESTKTKYWKVYKKKKLS